jgi:hypothetical protein
MLLFVVDVVYNINIDVVMDVGCLWLMLFAIDVDAFSDE